MNFVFDSNILIDAIGGNEKAIDLLAKCPSHKISIITQIDDAIVEEAARLRREDKIKSRLPDSVIYATALSRNCKLVTRNTKDFDQNLNNIIVPYQVN